MELNHNYLQQPTTPHPGDVSTVTKTMLSEMMIDIYASRKRDNIWILHDKPFVKELMKLRYIENSNKLFFVFADESIELGSPINKNLEPFLRKGDEITFIQMNGNEIADTTLIPLEYKENE